MENWRRKYGLFFWKKRTNNTFSQRSETFIGNFRHTWSLDKWKIWVTWSVSAGGNLQFLQNSSTAVSNEPVTVIALSPVCTTFLTLFTTFFKQHNWKKSMKQSPSWFLKSPQPVKKFMFYGTWWFITRLRRIRHRWIQSIPPHPTYWISILILSPHLLLGLPSGLFLSDLPTKALYEPLLSPYVSHAPPILFFPIWSLEKYLVGDTDHKDPGYVIFSTSFFLVTLRPKYLTQHPILENPQPMFLPLCERPSFTPIQNGSQNYSSAYLNVYVFG